MRKKAKLTYHSPAKVVEKQIKTTKNQVEKQIKATEDHRKQLAKSKVRLTPSKSKKKCSLISLQRE